MIPFRMGCNGCILVSTFSRSIWYDFQRCGICGMGWWDVWSQRNGASKRNISYSLFCSNSTMPSPIHIFLPRSIFQRRHLSTKPIFRTNLTKSSRWRHAHNHQPHFMAHNRWCDRSSARMVPRPCYRILLYEPRLWH